MDGCSGFSPDHLSASKSNIQFSCGYDHPGNPAEGGIRRQMAIVKKLQRPQRSLQPIFRNKKSYGIATTEVGEVLVPPFPLKYDETVTFGLKSFLFFKHLTYEGIKV